MASIRLEDEARKDPRFVILGKKLGTTKFDARARMEELWAYCTEKQSYYISAEVIDVLAEFEGFAKLILLDEIGLAEASDKGIRIKGTRGRIEWLKKLRNSSKKGGDKTKAKWQAKRLAKEGPKEGPLSLAPVPSPVPVKIQKEEKENSNPDFLKACKESWQGTLDFFKTGRKVSLSEENEIARAIRQHGPEIVDLALYGARHEAKSESFDPSLNVSIGRVLQPDKHGKLKIDKFANLGGQARTKEAERKNIRAAIDAELAELRKPPEPAIGDRNCSLNLEEIRKITGMKALPKESA